jgi:7-keto-8-aminopelargonate synthetase-like enzyme
MLRKCMSGVFVVVKNVYSMDGTAAQLRAIPDIMDEVFPAGIIYFIVDEAHATGLYAPGGRGIVTLLVMEDRLPGCIRSAGRSLHQVVRASSICLYELLCTGTHSRVFDEHIDSELSP